MKKLVFAISVTLFSLLGLHAYAADTAMTHGLKSNHTRNWDARNEEAMPNEESQPATDTKPDKAKKIDHKKTVPHKRVEKSSKHKKHPSNKRKEKK